jgi:hypothetical protein
LLIALTVALCPDNTEQSPMTEVLTKLNPGELVGLFWTAGPIFCALVWIILGHVLEYHRVSVAGALKKAMVERGMTPEEIRLVMDAGSKGERQEKSDPQDGADGSADRVSRVELHQPVAKGSQAPCKGPAEVEV